MNLLSRNLLVVLIVLFVASLFVSSTNLSSPLSSLSTNPTTPYQSDAIINPSLISPLDTSINSTIHTSFTTSACTTSQITAPDGRCIDVVAPTVLWNLVAADESVFPWTDPVHTTVDGLNSIPINLIFHHSISQEDVPDSATSYIQWQRYRQRGDEWVLDFSSSSMSEYVTISNRAFGSEGSPTPVGTFFMKIIFKTLYSTPMNPEHSVTSPIIRIYSACFATLAPSYTPPTDRCTGGHVCTEKGTCNRCEDGFYATDSGPCVQINHPTITFKYNNSPISGSVVLKSGQIITVNALALIGDQNGGANNNLHVAMKMYQKGSTWIKYVAPSGIIYTPDIGGSERVALPHFPGILKQITTIILEIETTSSHALNPKKITQLEITVIPTCMNSVTVSNCPANFECIHSENTCQCIPPNILDGPSSCLLPYIDPIIGSVTYTTHRTTEPKEITPFTDLFVGSYVTVRLQQPPYDPSTHRLGPAIVIVQFNGIDFASSDQLATTDGAFVEVKIKLPIDTINQVGVLTLRIRQLATNLDLYTQEYQLHTMPLCYNEDVVDDCGTYGQCNVATNHCDCIDNFIEVNYRCVRPGPVITVDYEITTPESTRSITIEDGSFSNIHPNAPITIRIVSSEVQTATVTAQLLSGNDSIVKSAEVNN